VGGHSLTGKEGASLGPVSRPYEACCIAVQVTFNRQYRYPEGLLGP